MKHPALVVLALLVFSILGSAGTRVQAQDPGEVGEWTPIFPMPHVAVHCVLFHTGKVMFWAYSHGAVALWEPGAADFTEIPSASNMFCAGQSILADGRLLVAGGNVSDQVGLVDTNIFDPVTETWSEGGDMTYGRWYPTCTTLPDGRILVMTGDTFPDERAVIPEVYDPETNQWTQLPGAEMYLPLFVLNFVVPDGRVFTSGPMADTFQLDVDAELWSFVDTTLLGGGSAVQYRPGEIMKCGGGNPAVNGIRVIDMNDPDPEWQSAPPMLSPRDHHNSTVLPDGQVFISGGTIGEDEPELAVLVPEMWNPETELSTAMAPMAVPRMYHSTTLLLPDARVLSAGGDNYPNAQIYSPPYLFQGPRPVIESAPTAIGYGAGFFVATPDAAGIASAVLIRSGAVTHGFDQSQRLVPVSFSQTMNGLVLVAPTDGAIAPPGYYMLFLIDESGIPSESVFIQVGVGADVFIRGDFDGDGELDLTDAIDLLGYLFLMGPPPAAPAAADVNDDASTTLIDGLYLLAYLFQGGAEPPAPFPDPGVDPTP